MLYAILFPAGDQTIASNGDRSSAVRILRGDSPCDPINQISCAPSALRPFPYTMWEPSGETFPPPTMSSTSASLSGVPPRTGTDHTLTGLPGDGDRSDESSGVGIPASHDPSGLQRINAGKRRHALGLACLDELQMNALPIDVTQVFTIRRNRGIEYREIPGAGGKPSLLELSRRFGAAR